MRWKSGSTCALLSPHAKWAAISTTLPISAAPPIWGSPWQPNGNGPTTLISGTPGQGHDAEDGGSDLPTAYWNRLRTDALPLGVDLSVVDMSVNAGISSSTKLLQRALGFIGDEVDGSIGPETLAAVDRFDTRALVNNLADRQTAYYGSLANFPIFGTGWLRRTKARHDAALAMLQSATTVAA